MCDQGEKAIDAVTTGQFLLGLLKYFSEKMDLGEEIDLVNLKSKIPDTIWIYGRTRGWLEAQDQISENRNLEKRHAARIVHEFLRIEGNLADERDWSSAKKLEDLYHCRVCAKHVAQVYVRGLMKAKTERRFGLLDTITEAEMHEIFNRMSKIIFQQSGKELIKPEEAGSF